MYNKEARRVLNNMGSAIDALSRAQTAIQVSEVHTNRDREFSRAIFDISNNIRELRNEIREDYADMNN